MKLKALSIVETLLQGLQGETIAFINSGETIALINL